MEAFKERLLIEQHDLNMKINALDAFINTNSKFKELDSVMQALMCIQYDHMVGYSTALGRRMNLLFSDEDYNEINNRQINETI